jgi:hypothetical protein
VTAVFLGSRRFFNLSARNVAGLTGCTKAHFFSHCTAVHVCIVFNGMLNKNLYWFILHLPIILSVILLNFITFLIFMDPWIVDNSVEIPTRCSFVIEFIIPKFIEGSTCFQVHTAHHQEL